jgi:hypothetical protein
MFLQYEVCQPHKTMRAVHELMEQQGLTPADIPLGIVMYNVASLGLAILTWSAFYHYSPHHAAVAAFAEKHAEKRMVMSLQKSYNASISWAERRIASAPSWMGVQHCDSKRLATSFAESNVFRKVLKPLTMPPKLMIASALVRAMPWRENSGNKIESHSLRQSYGAKSQGRRRSAICKPGAGC